MEPRVIILGCGPAALIAAECLQREHSIARDEIKFYALHQEPSPIGGAQYLHEPPVENRDKDPDGRIEFVQVGTPEGYAFKVYGSEDVPTSWQDYQGMHAAWSLVPYYADLWRRWQYRIEGGVRVTTRVLRNMQDANPSSLILSSIPAPAICLRPDEHNFRRANILIHHEDEEFLPLDNVVIYNGRPKEWYRACKIFGECWTEWSHKDGPPGQGYQTGFKPLGTDCNCFSRVGRIGRFGQWDRKVLLSDVPTQVQAAMLRLRHPGRTS